MSRLKAPFEMVKTFVKGGAKEVKGAREAAKATEEAAKAAKTAEEAAKATKDTAEAAKDTAKEGSDIAKAQAETAKAQAEAAKAQAEAAKAQAAAATKSGSIGKTVKTAAAGTVVGVAGKSYYDNHSEAAKADARAISQMEQDDHDKQKKTWVDAGGKAEEFEKRWNDPSAVAVRKAQYQHQLEEDKAAPLPQKILNAITAPFKDMKTPGLGSLLTGGIAAAATLMLTGGGFLGLLLAIPLFLVGASLGNKFDTALTDSNKGATDNKSAAGNDAAKPVEPSAAAAAAQKPAEKPAPDTTSFNDVKMPLDGFSPSATIPQVAKDAAKKGGIAMPSGNNGIV